eukprot:5371712-Pyramimonas_sp.AAC.1
MLGRSASNVVSIIGSEAHIWSNVLHLSFVLDTDVYMNVDGRSNIRSSHRHLFDFRRRFRWKMKTSALMEVAKEGAFTDGYPSIAGMSEGSNVLRVEKVASTY